ncbi:MAG: arsenate reductase (glutaredoxin) [Bacteroidales bacterium]
MIKIYHNPRCKKSRAGLEYLKSKGVEFEVVEYLKNPPAVDELKDLMMRLNVRPGEMVRTQEEIYRKQLKGKQFTDDEWLKILSENPRLLKRPVVVNGFKAVWADPPGQMDKIL